MNSDAPKNPQNNDQKTKMTQEDVNRVKSAEAKASGGQVSKDGFAARAERAAARDSGNGGGKK